MQFVAHGYFLINTEDSSAMPFNKHLQLKTWLLLWVVKLFTQGIALGINPSSKPFGSYKQMEGG